MLQQQKDLTILKQNSLRENISKNKIKERNKELACDFIKLIARNTKNPDYLLIINLLLCGKSI